MRRRVLRSARVTARPVAASPRRRRRPRRPTCSSPNTSRARPTTRRSRSTTAPAPPIDLAAGGYSPADVLQRRPPPAFTIALTGTVAAGDVFVFAALGGQRRDPGPGRPDQRRRLLQRRRRDRAAQGRRRRSIDSIGQVGVDPGTEWGTGLTSTADNTLRRKATVEAGDTDPTDAFDPADAVGRLRDRHLRRARRAPHGGGPVDRRLAHLRRRADRVRRYGGDPRR